MKSIRLLTFVSVVWCGLWYTLFFKTSSNEHGVLLCSRNMLPVYRRQELSFSSSFHCQVAMLVRGNIITQYADQFHTRGSISITASESQIATLLESAYSLVQVALESTADGMIEMRVYSVKRKALDKNISTRQKRNAAVKVDFASLDTVGLKACMECELSGDYKVTDDTVLIRLSRASNKKAPKKASKQNRKKENEKRRKGSNKQDGNRFESFNDGIPDIENPASSAMNFVTKVFLGMVSCALAIVAYFCKCCSITASIIQKCMSAKTSRERTRGRAADAETHSTEL